MYLNATDCVEMKRGNVFSYGVHLASPSTFHLPFNFYCDVAQVRSCFAQTVGLLLRLSYLYVCSRPWRSVRHLLLMYIDSINLISIIVKCGCVKIVYIVEFELV